MGGIADEQHTASAPRLLEKIFDGTEVLTGVTAIPWYSREIYIP